MNLRDMSSRAMIPLALALPFDRREPPILRTEPARTEAVTIDLTERRRERELRFGPSANDPLYFYL